MKKQLIKSLVLVLGLTSMAQPSFAMKRNHPAPSDAISVMISTAVMAARWFLDRQSASVQFDNPYSFQPNHITFVSQTGTHFNVVYHDLDAFLHLSPSIATLVSDLSGTDISMLPLPNVHDSALYVLTEIASGADHEVLLDYIRKLNDGELQDLKKDAELLDSQALKDLISNAKDNPFTWLPPEVIPLILEKVGPKSRSSCASVDKTLNNVVATVREPVAQGGLGCTDMLPIVATIQTGRLSLGLHAVVHGQMLYVVDPRDDAVSVIDTNTNEIVTTIEVGESPLHLVVQGQMLYVACDDDDSAVWVIDANTNEVVTTINVGNYPKALFVHAQMIYVTTYIESSDNGTIDVIDTNTNQVVQTIELGNYLSQPVVHGQMLYVASGATINVIDTTLHQIVHTIEVGGIPMQPLVHGQMLYVVWQHEDQDNGSVLVIDTNTNLVVDTIEVGREPHPAVVHGQMIYVANWSDGTVSVIDANKNKAVHTIEVGGAPMQPLIHRQIVYVSSSEDNSIYMIDTNTNLVVAIIEVGHKPQQLTVHGQMLYVTSDDGTISVIDIGGYLPGQL